MSFNYPLPEYSPSHKLEEDSKITFQKTINRQLFQIQKEDKRDYGTDLELELIHKSSATNFRLHIQLKATEKDNNVDGSISIPVDVKNIFYLSHQKYSLYICYHKPSNTLFVKSVGELLTEKERDDPKWKSQDTITIRFYEKFNDDFQTKLHKKIITAQHQEWLSHQKWNIDAPTEFKKMIIKQIQYIQIPDSTHDASQLLSLLYQENEDATISHYFDIFITRLDHNDDNLILLYLAEINLAINNDDNENIRSEILEESIQLFQAEITKTLPRFEIYSMYYNLGNAYLGTKQFHKAIDAYLTAIKHAQHSNEILGMSYKNLGSCYNHLNKTQEAKLAYEKALHYQPDLPEAHFALAMLHKNNQDYQKALNHIDSIYFQNEKQHLSMQAWRLALLLKTDQNTHFFRQLNELQRYTAKHKWVLYWSAKYVSQLTFTSIEIACKSSNFWKKYLSLDTYNANIAKEHYLLAQLFIYTESQIAEMKYIEFKNEMTQLINNHDPSHAAFLWDRIGHWAQVDNLWEEAELCYKKAYDLNPQDHYGYCLGVALIHLGKPEQAIPLLIEQATIYQPDELSWYNLGVAYSHSGQFEASIHALQEAIKIRPLYEEAWFNLGGNYWNLGKIEKAKEIWAEAIQKFPDSKLNQQIKNLEQ
ncbi:tetratricopeptide repeat protein [Wohlfahrtiimonas larvae]|uniref:DUF4365 domain-containing protein n=1 Tax=Wohlfahrtiimonas larvae TaxID=1157986 RepID=A0ABP9MIJ3_9GAMM|nr:tetratricopeptide repeat protein [Wohlfahrtiimonas larvae]